MLLLLEHPFAGFLTISLLAGCLAGLAYLRQSARERAAANVEKGNDSTRVFHSGKTGYVYRSYFLPIFVGYVLGGVVALVFSSGADPLDSFVNHHTLPVNFAIVLAFAGAVFSLPLLSLSRKRYLLLKPGEGREVILDDNSVKLAAVLKFKAANPVWIPSGKIESDGYYRFAWEEIAEWKVIKDPALYNTYVAGPFVETRTYRYYKITRVDGTSEHFERQMLLGIELPLLTELQRRLSERLIIDDPAIQLDAIATDPK